MRLRPISDLHMELRAVPGMPFSPPSPAPGNFDFDVLAVIGDVWEGDIVRSIAMTAKLAGGRPAVFVGGNHEQWGWNFTEVEQAARAAAAKYGVHYLENDTVIIDGVKFAGATLWDRTLRPEGAPNLTNIMSGAEREPPAHLALPFNEPVYLPGKGATKRATNLNMRKRHEASADFLRAASADVVLTHYPPGPQLVEESCAKLWAHGHIHMCTDKIVGSTRVLCNSLGYPAEAKLYGDNGFNPSLTVEIEPGLRPRP